MKRALAAFCLLLAVSTAYAGSPPKNIIFLIGDGMGFEQVKAAGMYLHGAPGTLSFESLPYPGQITPNNAFGYLTDSAAAGTAMATGYKVDNGVISQAYPARDGYPIGSNLPTMLELFAGQGKTTGLVTTSYITDATPAAFGAHAASRSDLTTISNVYFNQTRPNILMGGSNGLPANIAQNAGYTVVQTAAALQALDLNATTYLSGQFGAFMPGEAGGMGAYPHLSQMAASALDMLDNDPDGFFLMVEGGLIDPYCHQNNLAYTVAEVVEFSNTVQTVLNWALGRTDTLVIVTADHETGGLTVLQNNGQDVLPTVSWSTGGHTTANVPVFAWGVNANLIHGTLPNTSYFQIVQAASSALIGDVNLDGSVNALDISPFINYLVDGSAAPAEADCNGDGQVNALDIAGCVQAITGGIPPVVVPEPATLTLLCAAVLALPRRPHR